MLNVTNRAVCKSGPALPFSTSLKNVLWIGDSLSIGMMPFVAANLSDIALVQHAPWGIDGGAEETAYGLYCLDSFLHSPAVSRGSAALNARRRIESSRAPLHTLPRRRGSRCRQIWCSSTLACTMGR